MPRSVLRVGTRGSARALAQAEAVRRAISAALPNRTFELVPVVTEADESDAPAPGVMYVRALQDALRAGKIDLAVHNAADLPAGPADGLSIGSILMRDDPREALVTRTGGPLETLNPGTKVGANSVARRAQLLAANLGLVPAPITGSLDERLRKLIDGEIGALLCSAAGLKRVSRLDDSTEILPINVMLPAPGQGAVAVECRAGERNLRPALAQIEDAAARAAFDAERSFVIALAAPATAAVAALAEVRDGIIRLRGLVATPDGKALAVDQIESDDPEKAGIALAEKVRARA